MIKDYLQYLFLRILIAPFSYLPYSTLHSVGRQLGRLAFQFSPYFRKRTISNLGLAKDLHLSEEQIIETAKESFGSLFITLLEYAKFSKEKDFHRIIECENHEEVMEIYNKGSGLILFCAHQANWEALFLYGNLFIKGIAIGKSLKNPYLCRWIRSIREKTGGTIVEPKHALQEGIHVLKQGQFIGILGDQGMPNSSFSSLFLGRKAFSTTAPALLAYKTGAPIVYAEIKRGKGKYIMRLSKPLYANREASLKEEVYRLTSLTLALLEKSIKQTPHEWLWIHNRWKQELPGKLKKRFRQDSLCLILPPNEQELSNLLPYIPTLLQLYQGAHISCFIPKQHLLKIEQTLGPITNFNTVHLYDTKQELLRTDIYSKLIFDFAGFKPLKRHYLKKATFALLSLQDLQKLSRIENPTDLSLVFQKALSV